MSAHRVTIIADGDAVLVVPTLWGRLPEDGARVAPVPVAGGLVVVDPADPEGAMGAWIADPDAAAWWLSGVFGEDVARAALTGAEAEIAVEWGELALPLRRAAMGLWLHRWWPSHSPEIPALHERLLRAEIGVAAWNAEPCMPDVELAGSLLGAGASALPGALRAVNDLTGARFEEAERLAWEAVHAALDQGDLDAETWQLLTTLAVRRRADDAEVAALLHDLDTGVPSWSGADAEADADLALTAGFEDAPCVRGDVDWRQVHPRHVADVPGNVVIEQTIEDDGVRLSILVRAGDELNEDGLWARVYLGDSPIPARQVRLETDGDAYIAEVVIPADVEFQVDVFDPRLVSPPRFDDIPAADRDYVRRIVAARQVTPLTNPVGPFLCELLAWHP
ncbi:MAG TPA: hypothetical protein PKE40_01265 [Arachnia sp.]|nr:hypothetical protein [Arachnia sp.]HMT84957.1 hypothetical protein [Arachnia sp.]